ncbi:MAG: hypothetical protein OXI71_17165, partial [Gemmatimonadota bacterium]|nr:hypothetical protein [Gemmatimonadota bacterium]
GVVRCAGMVAGLGMMAGLGVVAPTGVILGRVSHVVRAAPAEYSRRDGWQQEERHEGAGSARTQ